MRGVMKGRVVGRGMLSSSGVHDLSACLHDSGGSCRFPEKRLRPLRRSTPSVQAGEVKDSQSGESLLSSLGDTVSTLLLFLIFLRCIPVAQQPALPTHLNNLSTYSRRNRRFFSQEILSQTMQKAKRFRAYIVIHQSSARYCAFREPRV